MAQAIRGSHLRVDLVDIEKIVKVNELKPITNPVTFARNTVPTSDGLLSNEIFGITKYDRANTMAYIDLHEEFMHPLIYKLWCKLDSNVKACVHGTKSFIINNKGELEESEDGSYGIPFLKKNINRIKFRRTDSNKRDMNVSFIEKHINDPGAFIKKYLVVPAYYRDVNTDNGRIGLGEINELYRSLIISVKALRESADYGLTLSQATRGRIQENLLQIYNWFGAGTTINGETTSPVIPSKRGILRMAVNTKTTDNSTRLVITAPQLKVEKVEEIEATLDYSVLPLASALVNFMQYIIHYIRRTFENEFSGDAVIPFYSNKTKEPVKYLHVKDYQTVFSNDKIKREIERFLTGNTNRLVPITVDTVEGQPATLRFIGYNMDMDEYEKLAKQDALPPPLNRSLTWCDIFYIAAVEVVKDKHILITRYPIDSYYNQFPTKVKVASTIKTEPLIYNGKFYKNYPFIRQDDIGKDTSNMFIDSLNLSNLYLDAIGGDYDGDMVTVKSVYGPKANAELDKELNSVSHYIDIGGKSIRVSDKEAIQAVYNLTMVLPEDTSKITNPVF